ncbi:MAG: flagellar export protein FliJ [Ignavibacteriales bacterium]|nr:flagellar export protein FliJ [Ignavibacteriales bacterium]
MAKFNYRFTTLLNAKEILEKKIKEEISIINREIENLKQQRKLIVEERLKTQKEMVEKPLKVSEFQSAKMYDSILERQIQFIDRKTDMLKLNKEQKQIELIEKKKEVKSFEILKENQLEAFLLDERKQELKELNEIAIRNYNGNQN